MQNTFDQETGVPEDHVDRFQSDSAYDIEFGANAQKAADIAKEILHRQGGEHSGWRFEVGNTGGGVLCITASNPSLGSHPEDPTNDNCLDFGTASGYWGWTDVYGEQFGDAGSSPDGRQTGAAGNPRWDADAAEVGAAIAYTLSGWQFPPASTWQVRGGLYLRVVDGRVTGIEFEPEMGVPSDVVTLFDGTDGMTADKVEEALATYMASVATGANEDARYPIGWQG